MAETVNEQIQDLTTRHDVGLSRYSNAVVARIVAHLNRTEDEIVRRLQEAAPGARTEFQRRRLEAMLASIRDILQQGYNQITPQLAEDLQELVGNEAAWQAETFRRAIPQEIVAQLDVVTPPVEQLKAAVYSQPFQGRLLRESVADMEDATRRRLRDAIRQGFTQGETVDQITRRIRGTKSRGFKDGLMEISRRDAEAVARTAVGHMASHARMETMKANESILKGIRWDATLDGRTTAICRVRDGLLYSVDGKPQGHSQAWLGGPGRAHWQCRSSAVPVTKSWRDLGIDVDEIPQSTRASMNGQVPGDTTYADWLRKQDAEFIDDVLGQKRGKLFREGGLSLDRFVNNKGRRYTLEELRRRDEDAFRKAGL